MATSKGAKGGGNIRKKVVIRNGKQYAFWEARLTVGRDPGTGRQIQKSFTGKTQKEVREKMQSAAVSVNDGTYFEPTRMTLTEWIEIWLAEYTGDVKYLTEKHYEALCKNHIIPALGAVKLSRLTTPQIQKFYNDLQREGMSSSSVRNLHACLTKCLSVAIKVGYIRNNPASMTTLPKMEKADVHPLTDEQVKAFLEVSRGDEYENLFKVILFTGLRKSEAIGLTWDCVDFKTGTLKICKQLQKRPAADGGFTFAPLKNNKPRILKPAPSVMAILKRQKGEQAAQRLAAGELWQGWETLEERNTALVFTTATGSPLINQTVSRHFKKLAARIGAPESCVHDLRHTFAVLAIQGGDDVKTVQENLGHHSAAFTLDVYAHVSQKMKEDSAERMEGYIQAISNL